MICVNMRDKLETIILSSYEAMYKTAYTYMRNEQDAMDVVQEAVVKAIKRIEQVREEAFLKTWLFRILINTAMDELKQRKKVLPLLSEAEEGREDVYEDMDVLRLLDNLDDTEKKVITLRYFEEWKIEDISGLLEMNVNTVKSILYRSLKKMKAKMVKGEALS